MNLKSVIGAVALAAALLVSGAACKGGGGYATAKTLGPGKHKVVNANYGLWYAHDAQSGCAWSVTPGDSFKMKKNSTPAIQLGTGNKGATFWPNDACGTWTRNIMPKKGK